MSAQDRRIATAVVARLLDVNERTARYWAERSLANLPLPPRVAELAGSVERHPTTGALRWDPVPVRALRARLFPTRAVVVPMEAVK